MDTESTPESADEVISISSTTDGLYYVALIIVAAVILCAVTVLLLYYSRKRRSKVHADLTGKSSVPFVLTKWTLHGEHGSLTKFLISSAFQITRTRHSTG